MPWIKIFVGEILGLFVDDGRFALSIVIWLAVAWLMVSYAAQTIGNASGPILFVGFAVILLESAWRQAHCR
jgi:hypothetical protein